MAIFIKRITLSIFVVFQILGVSNFSSAHAAENSNACAPSKMDGATTKYVCFQISEVKFGSKNLTLNGRGVLLEVILRGQTTFLPAPIPNFRNIDFELELLNNTECGADFSLPTNGEIYSKIGNPVLPKSSWALTDTGPIEISYPLFIPQTCKSGRYHVAINYSSEYGGDSTAELVGVSGNSLTIIQKSKRAVVGTGCKTIGTFGATSKGESVVCAKLSGKIIWAAISGESPSKSTPSVPKGPKVGSKCSKPGETKTYNSDKYACVLKGGVSSWILISSTKSSSSSSSDKSKSDSATTTEADSLKRSGCTSFPSAIINLQNATGSASSSALVNAQRASNFIVEAAMLDSKYQSLKTSQFIIIQYVQATNWSGNGFYGDINNVRMAIDNFNSACGSNLSVS